MNLSCQNCGQGLNGTFCSNCGQKKYSKIDKKYIFDEIQYTFLHFNKGFLYTIKSVFINPGKTAKEFIEGKRVNHYKPILFLFVLSGISTFISYKIIGLKEIMARHYATNNVDSVEKSNVMSSVFSFITDYNTLIMIAFVPFLAIATKIAYRKKGNNYYEHVVMNTFLLSFYTLLNFILVYPLMFFLKNDSPSFIISLSSYSLILFPIIYVFFFKEFYKQLSVNSVIFKSVLISILIFVQYLILMIIGFTLYAFLK